jgi:hypothetical protein
MPTSKRVIPSKKLLAGFAGTGPPFSITGAGGMVGGGAGDGAGGAGGPGGIEGDGEDIAVSTILIFEAF